MRADNLTVDFCDYAAARYACANWHYSSCMPAGKTVKFGAWEEGRFIGAVIFGRGVSRGLLMAYGLGPADGCELTRVALRDHQAHVTRIVAVALRLLKRHSPDLRLVVSFADPMQNHIGGIYQAGNWLYTGRSTPSVLYRIRGHLTHRRSVGVTGGRQTLRWVRANLDSWAVAVRAPGKHRYLWPFDQAMRLQLLPLVIPYPKRAKAVGGPS